LLATTDPQKLPVTILSRCLQFNLRRLSIERIQGHLDLILGKEGISSEAPALLQLARAADGSMRDALSLLDQAIAFGNGVVNENDVRAMLGSIEQHYVFDLLDALALADGSVLIQRTQELAQHVPDFAAVLAEIITCLHYLALLKLVPNAYEQNMGDKDRLFKLANALSAEDIQLYYQIALTGRRDLPLAPDPRNGLEMVLLRMLAFRPDSGAPVMASPAKSNPAKTHSTQVKTPDGNSARTQAGASEVQKSSAAESASQMNATSAVSNVQPVTVSENKINAAKLNLTSVTISNWHHVVASLNIGGMLKQLAEHSAFVSIEGSKLHLGLAPTHTAMLTSERENQLQEKLSEYFEQPVQIQIEATQIKVETPAARTEREQQERQLAAEQSIVNDDNVKNIMDAFNARVDMGSVQALNTSTENE
jgi:DNA polymerase-3 subunit gamma/tau